MAARLAQAPRYNDALAGERAFVGPRLHGPEVQARLHQTPDKILVVLQGEVFDYRAGDDLSDAVYVSELIH